MAIDFSKIKFFVEGDADIVFVRDVLLLLYAKKFDDSELKELIVDCKGYNNLGKHKDIFSEIEKGKKRDGGKNIVVFDADYTGRENSHGFKNKLQYLLQEKETLKIKFELFLFPDNCSDGTLETLLECCLTEEHAKLIKECWRGLESCVMKHGNGYTIPADKSKIYFYLECLHGETNAEKDKVKDKNRNFTDTSKWYFDFENTGNLKALKLFLDEHLLRISKGGLENMADSPRLIAES